MSDAAKAAGGVCAGSLLLSLYAKSAESKPAHVLRPPGALEEGEFSSAHAPRAVRTGLSVKSVARLRGRLLTDLGQLLT